MNCTLAELERFNYIHDLDFKDLPIFRLKTREFANKTVDFIVTRCNLKPLVEPFYGMITTYPKQLTDEEKEAKRLENIERAARRARQKVHFLVRQIGADHMLTLTTRENITDTEKFDGIFKEFVRLVRHKVLVGNQLVTVKEPNHWAYVAVRELQDRGALHVHIACVGKQNIPFLRACWYVALGGSPSDTGELSRGQVDVQYAQRRFSGQTETHKTFKLVQYLTKYISKTFDHQPELGKARYKSSRGIPPIRINKQYLPVYWSHGTDSFVDAMKHTIAIAEFLGVKNLEPFNIGFDMYRLTGDIEL